jgi:hypothetical protein
MLRVAQAPPHPRGAPLTGHLAWGFDLRSVWAGVVGRRRAYWQRAARHLSIGAPAGPRGRVAAGENLRIFVSIIFAS